MTATGDTTTRHEDSNRRHDYGNGQNGDGRHNDGKGQQGNRWHDDGNGRHKDATQ